MNRGPPENMEGLFGRLKVGILGGSVTGITSRFAFDTQLLYNTFSFVRSPKFFGILQSKNRWEVKKENKLRKSFLRG